VHRCPCLSRSCEQVGYSTHAIGKWHLGYAEWADTPTGRGFDSYAGYLQGGEDYYTHTLNGGMDLWRNQTAAWDAYGQHSTVFMMEEAKRILDSRHPAQPMFMYFAHQEVHAPLQVTPDSGDLQRCVHENVTSPIGKEATAGRHTLCTMASNMDTAVGTFVSMLKTKAMWENTLLWLTTDNGGMTYGVKADGVPAIALSVSSNFPLRGGKTTLFDGGVRGVSFVTGGFLPDAARGKTCTELTQHVDLPVTMAKLAGATWTLGTPDGHDIWDAVIDGAALNRTEIPVNVDTCVGATGGPPCTPNSKFNALIWKVTKPPNMGTWKLIEANTYPRLCPNTTWCTGAGLYDGWWTNDPYTHIPVNATTQGAMSSSDLKKGGLWLFDLSVDPNEERNVAASNPEIVKNMRERLVALANPENGYRDPQVNHPDPLALPLLHNGTWAPFKKLGEELQPMSEDYIHSVVAKIQFWD
jgi:arylsulfatase B